MTSATKGHIVIPEHQRGLSTFAGASWSTRKVPAPCLSVLHVGLVSAWLER